MTLYARIDDGVVVEFFQPPDEFANVPIHELFHSDLVWVDVSNVSPVPELDWRYDGTVFSPPPPPTPLTEQEQAFKKLIFPVVTIDCTSIPTLNGDYAVDNATRGNITGIAVAINAGLGLPSGETTFNYADVTGTPHAWPSSQFLEFAKKAMVYVYDLSQVAGGAPLPLPDAIITIA